MKESWMPSPASFSCYFSANFEVSFKYVAFSVVRHAPQTSPWSLFLHGCKEGMETLLPSLQKEKSGLKVSWPTCRLQKAGDFARVQAGGRAGLSYCEYYTRIEHEVHTPDSSLTFAIAEPAPHVFAVRSCGLCPLPGLHWWSAAPPVVSAPSCPPPALRLPSSSYKAPSSAAVLLHEQNLPLRQAAKWQLAVSICS